MTPHHLVFPRDPQSGTVSAHRRRSGGRPIPATSGAAPDGPAHAAVGRVIVHP